MRKKRFVRQKIDHKFFVLEKLVRIDKGKAHAAYKGNQAYDTSLKQWVKNDPRTIIPVLLSGAEFVEALDIERIRPTMRADRVFKIRYEGKPRILNVEFETGYDKYLDARLLAYNAILYLEFHIPVMSLIVYPFRTTMATSPLRTGEDGDELVTFHFERLPLFSQDARTYIQEHITCMYPLVPAMQGANAAVIESVAAELAALYREDEVTLSEQFVLMELLLSRTTTISKEEKAKIEGSLKMYDPLWEEHPKVKRIKAQAQAELEQAKADADADAEAKIKKAKVELEAEAEAKIKKAKVELEAEARARTEAEAKAKVEIEKARAEVEAKVEKAKAEVEAKMKVELEQAKAEIERERVEAKARAEVRAAEASKVRTHVLQVVSARFPELAPLAEQSIQKIDSPDTLQFLLVQIASAANETVARNILHPSAA